LVEGIVWGNDTSFNIDSVDGDGSSRSLNVVNNSCCWGWDRNSSHQDIISGGNINNPSGISIALIQNNISVLGHLSRSNGDIVSQRGWAVTSDGESRPLNDFNDVVSLAGKSSLVSSIASSDVIEFSVQASGSRAVSSDSVSQIISSSESCTDESVFSPLRSIWISFVMWVDFSR